MGTADQDDAQRFAVRSALVGAVLWSVLGVSFFLDVAQMELIPVLFLLGPLVAAPLGLGLLCRDPESNQLLGRLDRFTLRIQLVAAVVAALSFFFPAGPEAGLLAGAWLPICALVAVPAVSKLARRRVPSTAEACFLLARLYLLVGGVWLVLSRLGVEALGFAEPVVILTAVHFHFAGFATALIAGATARALSAADGHASPELRIVSWVVILGPAFLALGFLVSLAARAVLAMFFAAGLLAFSASVQTRMGRLPAAVRPLLSVSNAALTFGMILAVIYAFGEYTGRDRLIIPQMARWHGVANGLGFTLCGLLAWHRVPQEATT